MKYKIFHVLLITIHLLLSNNLSATQQGVSDTSTTHESLLKNFSKDKVLSNGYELIVDNRDSQDPSKYPLENLISLQYTENGHKVYKDEFVSNSLKNLTTHSSVDPDIINREPSTTVHSNLTRVQSENNYTVKLLDENVVKTLDSLLVSRTDNILLYLTTNWEKEVKRRRTEVKVKVTSYLFWPLLCIISLILLLFCLYRDYKVGILIHSPLFVVSLIYSIKYMGEMLMVLGGHEYSLFYLLFNQ